MSLARFFAPAAGVTGDRVLLPADEAEHLTRVLRLSPGDRVRVFNGRGAEFEAVVDAADRGGVRLRIGAPCTPAPEPRLAITLVQSVLKGDKMDDVVRDAVMIGVAASGRTPFTVAAIEAARAAGALTIGIANNATTPLVDAAEHVVVAATGSEIVAGSTRMKAGTAQKAALNLLSTTIMIRLGLVYDGRMVAMRVSNAKLLRRARAMVQDLTGVAPDAAADALERGDNDIRRAVLIARGMTPDDAAALLDRHNGRLDAAIAAGN